MPRTTAANIACCPFDSGRKFLNMTKKVRVLFVCMGNICRSPTAQGVFERVVEAADLAGMVEADSAGTHAYHIGNPPDERAQETAQQRGIDLSRQRARRFQVEDFTEFDYVLAMDKDNYAILDEARPAGSSARLHLFMEFAPQRPEREVPDPYYGGRQGFEQVFDMVEIAARGLLEEIRRRHLS